MSVKIKALLLGTAVVLVGGALMANMALMGIPEFAIWRAYSQKFNGGDRAHVNHVELYYETYGSKSSDKAPLVLLHGGLGFLETMHKQVRAFSEDRYVIAVDSRHHGRSASIEGPLHYEDMADDVSALLHQLNIAEADVFGWSDGGVIALELAAKYPKQIRSFAASGVTFHPSGLAPDILEFAETDVTSGVYPVVGWLFQVVFNVEPDRFETLFEKIFVMWASEPDFTQEDLSAIAVPALIIAGENDTAVRLDHMKDLASFLGKGELIVIENGTHGDPIVKADLVNGYLRDFFDN